MCPFLPSPSGVRPGELQSGWIHLFMRGEATSLGAAVTDPCPSRRRAGHARRSGFRQARVLACAALLLGALGLAPAHAGAVIVAAGLETGPLTAEQARRLFLGRERTLGGQPALPLYQQPGPLRERFDREVLNKSNAELNAYWSRLVFTGKGKAPEVLPGDAAVKARVLLLPGAVGYVDDAAVDASVKVLLRF